LELDKLLKKLSRFDVLMIDDFGYVKKDREEMKVLFTLLVYRYERGSMLI
jgi:DNA replication protein DnaC